MMVILLIQVEVDQVLHQVLILLQLPMIAAAGGRSSANMKFQME